MTSPSFYNPVAISILSASTWKNRMLSLIEDTGTILFLYSRSAMSASDPTGDFLATLESSHGVKTCTDMMSNPSFTFLATLRKKLGVLPKTIVALGGGSTIDIAKILIALRQIPIEFEAEQLVSIVEKKQYVTSEVTDMNNLIAIPTTAGTGSELTKWATVWDVVNKRKFSVEREDLYPSEAWVDPSLTVGIPRDITVSTALDALSHAVEAYWSNRSNPIVRRLSAQSITQITRNLPKVIEHPHDIEVREELCLGSVFAGLAFSQTRTTACHALSYPLTVRYGIPHGYAVALWLFPVMKLNWPAIQEKELFLSAFSCQTLEDIGLWLEENGSLDLRNIFQKYGIKKPELKEIYASSDFMKERLGNNPVDISLEQLFKDIVL